MPYKSINREAFESFIIGGTSGALFCLATHLIDEFLRIQSKTQYHSTLLSTFNECIGEIYSRLEECEKNDKSSGN